ncbi:hypothetical protein H6P81_008812 [Aristolochia fimbriata]|uniref:GPI-anchored protein LLG1-like domain-containing protein n=1 Tax=Aristolochia fimbriata TaxID=158543 RepID=A0AAV7EMC0_ARIFI|nr:hypothetical protein H6P81_008812 [Aristolochia fimbriata]
MAPQRCILALGFLLLVGVASSSFISDAALQSHGSTGRNLLQAKKSCPINLEFRNYTIITSQCKGPQYPPKLCCQALKDFACPIADAINDMSTDCASTMFSYINLYGKYPPGLFASECREGKEGLECPAQAPGGASAETADGSGVDVLVSRRSIANRKTRNRYFLTCLLGNYHSYLHHMSVTPFPLCSSNSPSSIRTPARRAPSQSPPPTIFLLQICQNLRELKQVHARLVVTGLLRFRSTALKLLESCVSISEIEYAWSVFERIPSPDTFGFNTLIRGLTLANSSYISILLYKEMVLIGCIPDNHTYTFVLKACSSIRALDEGQQVHTRIIKAGVSPNTHVHSSLIHMYANCNRVDCAERVFDEFPQEETVIMNSMISGYFNCGRPEDAREVFYQTSERDVATWSAMVSGYVKNEMYMEALQVFRALTVSEVKVNESVVVSALSACGRLGALDQGRWIHAYVEKIVKEEMSVVLGTAIVDMYAKCGSIETSYEIFCKMRMKDEVTWCAMILGFAVHGRADRSFELFNEMTAAGVRPNGAVFVAVLTACLHAGDVERGLCYFDRMKRVYGINPSMEHFGCMVGVLGRAGLLAEAEEFISAMPERPNAVIWATFLSGCRIHKDVRRGKRAFRHLLELEPMSGDRFKLMGLVFATTGNHDEAVKVWRLIKEGDMETTCGSSLIEVDGVVREFVAGDVGHEKAREVYAVIEGFRQIMDSRS